MDNEIYEGLDIYSKEYDYEDIKVAICVAEYLGRLNRAVDYEDVVRITIKIKEKWCELEAKGLLTSEQCAYIQKFAVDYLYENTNKIMEELR